jgi:hypothetical protein
MMIEKNGGNIRCLESADARVGMMVQRRLHRSKKLPATILYNK